MLWMYMTLHKPLLHHSPIPTGTSLANLWSKWSTEMVRLYDGNCGFQFGRRGISSRSSPFSIFSYLFLFSLTPQLLTVYLSKDLEKFFCVILHYKKKKKKKAWWAMQITDLGSFRFFTGKNIPEMFLSNASISICSSTIFSKLAMWY